MNNLGLFQKKKDLGGDGRQYIFLWVVGAESFQIIWVIGVRPNLITWVGGLRPNLITWVVGVSAAWKGKEQYYLPKKEKFYLI